LLKALLDIDNDDFTFYSRPSAFSDLRITKIDQICSGCDPIVFENFFLTVEYSYFLNPNKKGLFKTVAIRPANDVVNPYFILDKADRNGRQDGRGSFFRFYDNSMSKLTVSAPDEYGNFEFDYWLKNTEGKDQDTIWTTDIEITLNKNYQLVSHYARIQPKLAVDPDTINMEFEAGMDTIAINNIGTGELEWFTENENDWITIVNNPEGVDDYDLQFSVTNNYSDSARVGKIFIFANNSLNFVDSVMIVQNPSEYLVSFELPKGWAGISTWLNPLQPEVTDMFSQVESDLVILQNMEDFYWPEQNVNTIVDWDVNSGYMIKMDKATQLFIPGTQDIQQTLDLSSGWKLIPVLTDCNVTTSELLQNANFAMVKEVAGTNLYWPQYGINTLEFLEPGKSYFLLLNDTTTLDYSGCKQYKTSTNISNSYNPESPWNEVSASPVSHVFAIESHNPEVSHIGVGNTIGVFNAANQCCGFAVFGTDDALVTFLDDQTTETVDGLTEEEEFSMRLYQNDTKLSYELYAGYDESLAAHDGKFKSNGLSAINKLTIGGLILDEYSLKAVEFFPNPTNDILQINNVLPVELKYSIQSVRGMHVTKGIVQEGINSIDLSSCESGVYLITISTSDHSLTRRVIKN